MSNLKLKIKELLIQSCSLIFYADYWLEDDALGIKPNEKFRNFHLNLVSTLDGTTFLNN